MKIVIDSVIYTPEGITKHAREEAIHLRKAGHQIMLTDVNYNSFYDNEGILFDCYTPIDFNKDEYIYYINQPSIRHNNLSMSLLGQHHRKNIVYYLAFESLLPKEWVEVINYVKPKLILTPSKYSMKLFRKSGINKKIPIKVLHHGTCTQFYEEHPKIHNNRFTFLWIGTGQNRRKNLKLLYDAWIKEFANRDDVRLVVKMNPIYGINEENQRMLNHLTQLDNVQIITDVLSDYNMKQLIHDSDCYISTSFSEGFGINILDAFSLGTPVIATNAGGNMEFCNKKNCLLIESKKKFKVNEDVYQNIEWPEFKVNDLIKTMNKIIRNEKLIEKLTKQGLKTARGYSWCKVGKTLEKYFQQVLKH